VLDEFLRRSLLSTVYDVARETPLERAPRLSSRLGVEVLIKREDLQPIFSFKLRGAYHKMVRLPADVRARGVVAASAGNHAQGVALSAQRLGARAVIVMPVTTPSIKVEAVRALGAEVVLHGDAYDQAASHARMLEQQRGLAFVHPYDDPDVIAGQGTIGIEILKQCPGRLDAIFVPVGGGGLIAGVGAVVKALRPEVKIIAVEPEEADAMVRSLRAGTRVTLERVGRFAEGVAVRAPGEETFRVAQKVVDDGVTVTNDEMCAAIKDLFEDRRAVLEPSGALAFAGMKKWLEQHPEMRAGEGGDVGEPVLVAIASGANVNFDRLRHVAERAEVGERREVVLAVTIPEEPGSFRKLCSVIGARAVTEFNYRYAGAAQAHVFVGLRVDDRREEEELSAALRKHGYRVLDLTDDEIAKLHVRHLVGGRAPEVDDERLFAFWFPERVGALADFLHAMRHPWNISLFHYRNHGSDFGRVLVGLQVPKSDEAELQAFLTRVGFEWSDVGEDPACRLFLQ
jgi:threonine dehydratase